MPDQTALPSPAQRMPRATRRPQQPRSGRETAARLLLTALLAASAGAHAAAAPRLAAAGAAAMPTLQTQPGTEAAGLPLPGQLRAPWWMAFDDATLNLLVHAAQHRQAALAALQHGPADLPAAQQVDQARRQVVANYLGVRVLSARWLALKGVEQATQRQQQLLAASTPAGERAADERTELLAGLAQRRERVGLQQQALAAERAELLASLAGLCGLPAAELGDLLAPLLAQPQVPSFASAVPSKLPRSILRARADVAAAEAAVLRQLRSGGSHPHEVVVRMQQPEGWIDAEADRPIRTVATVAGAGAAPMPADPELEQFNQLLDQAAQEVTQDLRTLAERARLQSERAQLAEASRAAFQAARERLKTGEVSELQVLEQYQHLLVESDRFAAACGELAMAWLRLVASTGASEQVLVRR